jgi:ribosomal protein S28E/S33
MKQYKTGWNIGKTYKTAKVKIRNSENVKRICARNGRGPLGPRAVRTDGDSDEI